MIERERIIIAGIEPLPIDKKFIVVVNMHTLTIYSFLHEGETEDELLARAVESNRRDIDAWTDNVKNYPCKLYSQNLAEAKRARFEIMSLFKFNDIQRKHYLNKPIKKIKKELYYEMLNILPPVSWGKIQGVEMFCMSERYERNYTDQYASYRGQYYHKIVDMCDQSTWMHHILNPMEVDDVVTSKC